MPPILNANAIIMCSHGGAFKIPPTTAPTVMIGGAPALTIADVAAAFPAGPPPCPFLTPAGSPLPCLKLASATGGMATKVLIKGQPALLQTTQFITAGSGPPVPAMVQMPGNMMVQGS
jgi:hypothetical protein